MKKKKEKEELNDDELNAFLESFKEENPEFTEEELENVKHLFLDVKTKMQKGNLVKTLLFKMLKTFSIYLIVALAMTGFMNKAIILEPFWLVFPIVLFLSFYFVIEKVLLNYINIYAKGNFLIWLIGLVFTLCLFSLIHNFFPVFSSSGELLGYLIGIELFYKVVDLILLRRTINNWMYKNEK